MAVDPRKFTVSDRNCPPSKGSSGSRAKDFYSTLGKIGDLEVLNEANSKIGQGLRTLASISENVRNNAGPVPSIIRETGEAVLDAGADFVLDTVGVGARETRSNGVRFSPQVANRALGQAEAIYDAVRNGQLDDFEDLPTAIAEFSNLEILLRSIFTGSPRREDRFANQCVSPYARDLIARAPKHKFMFVVEFVLNEPYASQFGNELSEELAFVVKRAARPNITFDYEEVNFYNFRSKILKRHEYQPITMTFYDDHNGKAIEFWHEYLKALSPLSSRTPADATAPKLYESNSMNFQFFDEQNGPSNPLSAGTSALRSNANGITPTTVISHVNLYHVYRGGSKFDQYQFISPKITELTLDELDMTQSGDGSEVALTFTYDALAMFAGNNMDSETSNDLEALTDSGEYALRPAPASQGNAVTNRSFDVTRPITQTPVQEALTDVIDETIDVFTNG
jgi:hypothetical protein